MGFWIGKIAWSILVRFVPPLGAKAVWIHENNLDDGIDSRRLKFPKDDCRQ
jgi:hypothetical protein